MKIYFSVAFDLSRAGGKVVVGRETNESCRVASELTLLDPDGCFVATAGNAQRCWDNVYMAQCMKDVALGLGVPEERIIIGRGPTFNTDGEMRELARIAQEQNAQSICIIVKWWHAPRAYLLATYRLRKLGILAKPKIVFHDTYVGPITVLQEFLLAIPKTLLKICVEEIREAFS